MPVVREPSLGDGRELAPVGRPGGDRVSVSGVPRRVKRPLARSAIKTVGDPSASTPARIRSPSADHWIGPFGSRFPGNPSVIGRSIEPVPASRIASCQAYPCMFDAGSAVAPDQNASRLPSGDQASEVPGSPDEPATPGRWPPRTTTPPSGGATAIDPFRNGIGWRSRAPTRIAAIAVAATRPTTAAARRARRLHESSVRSAGCSHATIAGSVRCCGVRATSPATASATIQASPTTAVDAGHRAGRRRAGAAWSSSLFDLQGALERPPGVVEPPHGRPARDGEHIGDVGDRSAIHVMEDQNGSLVGIESGE